ncbi:MAG: alpha/beta hydrolase [Gordonia sp.]|uniref:alpha/beta fold hydrolase n=1 Tax=Gordonia sp. (in: high G+C Gram-positive bacteria) TaxID=84139 RepID=UPI001D62BF3F|nr:alpha/beta hydrolase [Gordonia sp. (in: high G+C Gram-positive bacteria)]
MGPIERVSKAAKTAKAARTAKAAQTSEPKERSVLLAGVPHLGTLGKQAAGGVAKRVTRREKATGPDPYADEDFKAIYDDQASSVVTDDGLALAVRTVDLWDSDVDAEPEVTVLFVHGFTLRMASWHFQRFQLAERWAGRRIRMVFFDHRGHGKSDRAPAETCTIAQLADDTAAVIRTITPGTITRRRWPPKSSTTGTVVLVGHSMGGMSLMALARRHSYLFGPDGIVSGVALVATAPRGITEAGLGQGLRNPVVDAFRASVRRAPRLVQAGRGITRSSLEPVLVAASFGPGFHSRAAGRAVEKIIQNTPLETLVNFLYALEDHDESTAFPVLAQVPSVVVGGSADQLTPLPNSVRMYADLGSESRLVVAQDAGHMVQMERPELVTEAIVDLVERRRVALPPPRRRRWLRGQK